jgi:hypothetical protein
MKIYLGIVGSRKVQEFKKKWNCGWCLTPDNNRVNEGPYILDNGAFSAWKNGQIWNETKFKVLVNKYPDYDFVVAPDIVCGGMGSLRQSLNYVGEIPRPLYLAVQDGMQGEIIRKYLAGFDGIFVGGSIPWKYQTARMWSDISHLHNLKCHVGRVGTYEGLIQMHFAGIDSVDTTTPSRHQDDYHIKKYYEYLKYQSDFGMIFV